MPDEKRSAAETSKNTRADVLKCSIRRGWWTARRLILSTLLALTLAVSIAPSVADMPHTPAPGSAERVAICDAARLFTMKNYIAPSKLPQPLVFHVDKMTVLGVYCYFEPSPLFKDGTPMDTRYIMDIDLEFCLAKSHGKWAVVWDLSRTDVPDASELKQMRRNFPKDFPLTLLPEDWRKMLEPAN
jgi:hypothetical protein